jgi:hypothetical protein
MPKDANGYTCLERSFFPIIGIMMVLVIIFEFYLVGIYSAEIEDISGVDTHCDVFTSGPLVSGIGLAVGMVFNMVWIYGRIFSYELGRVALLFWVASTIVGIAGAGGSLFSANFADEFSKCDKDQYLTIHYFAIVFLVISLAAPHYFAIKNSTDKIIGKLDRMSQEDLTTIKQAIDKRMKSAPQVDVSSENSGLISAAVEQKKQLNYFYDERL